jgi:hypothetical protein
LDQTEREYNDMVIDALVANVEPMIQGSLKQLQVNLLGVHNLLPPFNDSSTNLRLNTSDHFIIHNVVIELHDTTG